MSKADVICLPEVIQNYVKGRILKQK